MLRPYRAKHTKQPKITGLFLSKIMIASLELLSEVALFMPPEFVLLGISI